MCSFFKLLNMVICMFPIIRLSYCIASAVCIGHVSFSPAGLHYSLISIGKRTHDCLVIMLFISCFFILWSSAWHHVKMWICDSVGHESYIHQIHQLPLMSLSMCSLISLHVNKVPCHSWHFKGLCQGHWIRVAVSGKTGSLGPLFLFLSFKRTCSLQKPEFVLSALVMIM